VVGPWRGAVSVHTAQVRELDGCLLGRRLYETMLVWETDPSLRDDELGAAFADVWCAIPKVVFSRTLDSVQGNARLAEASLAEEVAAALDATDKDVQIGGAGLAAQAIELGLVDELRMFRNPVVIGGGTPLLPPVTDDHRAGPDRDQDVRLARDLRALQARPR
jgi:dihydrofolate reductase